MAYYKASIEILVDVDNEAEACDCVSEALRPLLREFEPQSSVVDWRYVSGGDPAPHDGAGFEYAENQTPALAEGWNRNVVVRGLHD